MNAPDYISPISAFKVLEYQGAGKERLCSPYRSKYDWWPVKSTRKADCRTTTHGPVNSGHDAPGETCNCGYYAYYNIEDAKENASCFRTVKPACFELVTLVVAWGQVVLHETGLRSEIMEVVAIHNGYYPLREDLRRIADDMDVPFLVGNELLDMASEIGTLIDPEKL